MIRVLIFWHMHQPFYKDLVTGQYCLPWTRMHALKDYYGMVAMLEEIPGLRMTFNIVPSLGKQLQEYAAGGVREPVMETAFKPPEMLTREECLAALRWLFQANYDRLIARYPRYKQLYGVWNAAGQVAERALPLFSNQDFADLQVLSQLAWFDELYQQRDPVIRGLAEKGKNYTRADQEALWAKHQELLGRVLGAYRAAQERGQIELTTSPFYHPILPLVCDTEAAAEAHPGGRLPRRFRHPEDARWQLERAIAWHEEAFGRRPVGLWPSEGSVSDEALALAAQLGFRWSATDEGVLGRTLGVGFSRNLQGAPENAASLYAGWDLTTPAGPLRLFFRDHQFSDLIGFIYSKMDPRDAAADLRSRIHRSAAGLADPVVSIILDGENAWEYYHESGREFLRLFYQGLAEDPEIRTVTGSDLLAEPARGSFSHIVPGSWINANFDVWIGATEDHRAWNLLSDARDFFTRTGERAPDEQRDKALDEILIAEGSDWCWWYGPEHHSHNDPDFDRLFRAHLSNVYRLLGTPAPLELAEPIFERRAGFRHTPPSAFVRAKVDGKVTTYFEWLGAGLYSPDLRQAAMHGGQFYFEHLYYGVDEDNFYLRLDFRGNALDELVTSRAEAHVKLGGGAAPPVEMMFHLRRGETFTPAPGIEAATGRIFELRASLATLGLRGAVQLLFQVVLVQDGLPVDLLPAQGWLQVSRAEPAA